MKSPFLFALGSSKRLALGSVFEHPPSPPTLQRVSRYVRLDDCVELCDAFAATRRGDGHDLCDHPDRSFCVSNFDFRSGEFCANIYWSTTENGELGLVYSRNQTTELTIDERSNPVSCAEAQTILALRGITTPGRRRRLSW